MRILAGPCGELSEWKNLAKQGMRRIDNGDLAGYLIGECGCVRCLSDYVLRYAASDYDCYHQGRYIGSRPTLLKAVAAVEEEQAKAARHPQLSPTADATIATYHEELRAIAARLHSLANRLAGHPAEQAPMRAQLTMTHIRISTALRSIQDAERSLRLAGQTIDVAAPLDAAA